MTLLYSFPFFIPGTDLKGQISVLDSDCPPRSCHVYQYREGKMYYTGCLRIMSDGWHLEGVFAEYKERLVQEVEWYYGRHEVG